MTATGERDVPLRELFAGRRGRLLAALLLAEFGVAVQGVATSTVLPLAAAELDGRQLYGAALAAAPLAMVLVLAFGGGARLPVSARTVLFGATATIAVGTAVVVTASSMQVLLLGSVVRGLAGGVMAGFGLTVLGALFEDDVRARVMKIFAVVWLLPSVLGPVVNAFVASHLGWRWALAWPAVVVVVARLMMGRDAGAVPWRAEGEPPDWRPRVLVVAGVALTLFAPSIESDWRAAVFVAGIVLAVLPAGRVLGQAVPGDRARLAALVVFSALSVLFTGSEGLLSVVAIERLDGSVVTAAVAVGAAVGGWALTGVPGLDPGRRVRDPVTTGMALLVVGVAVVLVVVAVLATWSLAPLAAGSLMIGLGTGTAYPRLSSRAFDALPPGRVSTVAVIVVFAEMAGSTVGSALGGGTYSLLVGPAGDGGAPYVVPYAVLLVLAVVTAVAARRLTTAPADEPVG